MKSVSMVTSSLRSPGEFPDMKLSSDHREIAAVTALLHHGSFIKQEGRKRCGATGHDRINVDIRPGSLGQSLIEFALLLPAFLLAVVVIFDLGRAVYYYSAIHNAAREGARYGIIHPNDVAGMKNRAVDYAIGVGLEVADVTAGLGTPEMVGGFPNPTVKVTVIYAFSPATPLMDRLLPGGVITLKGEAVMRTEILP